MWYIIVCAVSGVVILVCAAVLDYPEPWTKPGYGKRRRTDGMKGVNQHIGGDNERNRWVTCSIDSERSHTLHHSHFCVNPIDSKVINNP